MSPLLFNKGGTAGHDLKRRDPAEELAGFLNDTIVMAFRNQRVGVTESHHVIDLAVILITLVY